jgi:uncharacterized protein
MLRAVRAMRGGRLFGSIDSKACPSHGLRNGLNIKCAIATGNTVRCVKTTAPFNVQCMCAIRGSSMHQATTDRDVWSRVGRFAIGGWADGYTDPVFRLMSKLQCTRQAIVGPWGHEWPDDAYPAPAISYLQQCVAFIKACMRDGTDASSSNCSPTASPRFMVVYEKDGAVQLNNPNNNPSNNNNKCYQPGRWLSFTAASPICPPGTWLEPDASQPQAHYRFNLAGSLDRITCSEACTIADSAATPADDDGIVVAPARDSNSLLLGLASSGDWLGWGGASGLELPTDQSHDDSLSQWCFTSDSIDTDMHLYGFAQLLLTLQSDRPIAQVAVRLCQVVVDASSGTETSTLISKGVLNLTHDQQHASAEPLLATQWYRRKVVLQAACAKLVRGSRLRVALSTSYWPMCWPAPHRTSLAFAPSLCYLQLPLLPPTMQDPSSVMSPVDATGCSFFEPTSCVGLDIVTMREASESRQVQQLHDGRHVLRVVEDSGCIKYPDGLVYDELFDKQFTILPDDALSARVQVDAHTELKSEQFDMAVRIEIKCHMHATQHTFELHEELRAYDHSVLIFDRHWDHSIARNGC